MSRRINDKKKFIEKSNRILKISSIIIFIFLTLLYCIRGGFYSLIFDLKESKMATIYGIILVVLSILLIVFNIKDEPVNQSDAQKDLSSYITVAIIILLAIFGILLVFNLLDFFLPIIVLMLIVTIAYFVVKSVIKSLVEKYGIK